MVLRICRGAAGVNVVGGIVAAMLSSIRTLSAFRRAGGNIPSEVAESRVSGTTPHLSSLESVDVGTAPTVGRIFS